MFVCEMGIYPGDAAGTSDYHGQIYYFCGADYQRAVNKILTRFPGSIKGDIRGKCA